MLAGMASTEGRLEDKAGAWSSAGLGGRLGDGVRPYPEENGAADRLSEQSDASLAAAATAEQNRLQQAPPAGKLKKTAFKLFGGKRSICTLPSLFGGKNRGQGKGASKKGLSKSKTHDGISEVGCEGASAGRLRSPSDGGTEFPPPQLPMSQSALLATDSNLRVGFARQSASLSGSSEGFEKKSEGGDKSLFLPRPKKGLRGLFSSIRRHRKNKVAEPERTELQEWVGTGTGEQALTSGQVGVEAQEASQKGSLKSVALSPECRERVCDDSGPGIGGSLDETREVGLLAADERRSEGEAATGAVSSEGSRDAEMDMDDALCASSPYGGLPDALQPEDVDDSLPSVASGDQLSLMFGDVTSLKSFDSLTGCGDIIAEPDIDSIAESSTSAERSRDAAKRSSCLVTYQGGGEEMAVPDEIEEYLQQMWEGAIKAEASYEAHVPELMANCGANDGKPEAHRYVESTRSDADPLTPHSDQQESAPNSDEGYYDSTTPGPEDEAGEGLEEIKKDRLPRDSYSGDALYEFYEPDDILMSPSHGGDECWFDGKPSPPEIFGQFLDFALPGEKDLARRMGQKSDVMETEEERMAAIQKQLLYWEMQREPVLKHLDMLRKEQHPQEKPRGGCKTRPDNLIGDHPGCLGCEQVAPHALNSSLDAADPAGHQDWTERPETGCPEKHGGHDSPKAHSSYLLRLMGNGSMLGSDLEHPALESSALSGLALEKSVTYPFYRTHGCPSRRPSEQASRTEPGFGEPPVESRPEPEQAVNFSQALVEFTSSGTLFSSLSESLGSSDSGSVFAQNLPGLPTMVTFDIVDVEQEGEGECEQHLEMNTAEDLAASFEAFDERYLPKESFADCDERMFPGYALSTFQSCNWGVASLPRCLRLQEVSGPEPEPLSVCRRSRSLDTESLEFELASLQLSKNAFKPCELWSKWSSCKKDSLGPENSLSSPEEREGEDGGLSWPGLQNVSYGESSLSSPREVKPWDCDLNVPAFQSMWGVLKEPGREPPFVSRVDNSSKETAERPREDGTNHLRPLVPRSVARPLNLPLQTPVVSYETRDSMAKKLAWVLPLGDPNGESPPTFGFVRSPDKPAMCKPVGVAQGVSQLHRSNAKAFEDEAKRCGNSDAELLKGKASQNAPSAGCQNATMNVTIAK